MTERRINLALAVIFLIVGILATSNTFRLNNYIRETLPRDTAQEQCNAETLAVLKKWVFAREERDDAMDARDAAAIGVLDHLIAGDRPPVDELTQYRAAVQNAATVRRNAREQLVPLPQCGD